MSRIHILHCCGTMNVGGAETMVMNWFRNIDREKFVFDFLVFTEEKGVFDDEIQSLGGKIYYAPSLGNAGILGYIRSLVKVFKEIPRVDIVHSHMDWQGGFIAFAAYLAGIKKRIVHSHAMQEMFQSNLLHRFIIRISKILIQQFATGRLCCSEEAGKSLFGKKKFVVIKNAIDLEKFKEIDIVERNNLRTRYHITEEDFVLGCVGSISENKNQIFLLELLKSLESNIKLVLVGQGNMEQTLKKKVKEIGLKDCVIFTGLQRDVPKFASMFDLFVFPSKREGLGIVAVEMQALGIPCIISEGVPMEVDMGLDLVEQVPLENQNKWLEEIRVIKNEKRNGIDWKIREQKIQQRGYDIKKSIKCLENIYCGE